MFTTWFPQRTHPWFWTMDFGKRWSSKQKVAEITSLLTEVLEGLEIDLISAALSADWFQKHDLVNEAGTVIDRKGASMEIGKGIPGIYWYNGLGQVLCRKFASKLKGIGPGTPVEHLPNDRLVLLGYDSPDAMSDEGRRKAEAKVVECLGQEYFFNLAKSGGKRPRRRKPVEGLTDATRL